MSAETIWTELLGASVGFRGKQFRTRVIEAGDGEPLVLLHGNGGHAEAWSRNVLRLGKDFHVLAIDLMWHGLSSGREFTPAMVPAYAEQVIDLLDSIGAKTAHVEGESLGGWVAMWLALNSPDRLGKIILNTAAGAEVDQQAPNEQDRAATSSLRERSLAAINDPTRETVRARLEWLMASPDRVTDELVSVRQFFYQRPETRAGLLQVIQNSFRLDSPYAITRDMLAKITVPTLVLWSDHNPGAGPDYAERLAGAIPAASLYVIKDAGHWPQWEKPEEHDSVVTKFLRG